MPKLAKICQNKALKYIIILVLIFYFNFIQSMSCDGFSCECAGTCAMCEISPQHTVWFYYWNKYTIFSGHIFSCWIEVVIFRTRFLSLVHCVRRCVFVFWPTRPHEKKDVWNKYCISTYKISQMKLNTGVPHLLRNH